MSTLKVDSPSTGEIVAEVQLSDSGDLDGFTARASKAHRAIADMPLEIRMELCERWCAAIEANADSIAMDVSRQMGKPLGQAAGEVRGAVDRARQMIGLAPEALADDVLPDKPGFFRKIAKEPLGVVAIIAAWNYPLLIAVNGVIPAVLSGNSVILKHSGRTPLCGDAFAAAMAQAGAPENTVQSLHCSHATTADLVRHPVVQYAAFTGSVAGGRAVHGAAGGTFKQVATELGGKDPAYVAADADLAFTIPNLVEGSTWNAGQSCCAIERIYVHESVYDDVVAGVLAEASKLAIGDPLAEGTSLGAIAQSGQTDFLASQVKDAVNKGAGLLLGGKAAQVGGRGRYFEATVLANCNHQMEVMQEESFGPLIAIQKVSGDDEALRLMNDSQYGLTASIWTADPTRAAWLAPKLETGTVFMNRCDYLDPLLAWVGVKDTGRGVSLSRHGFSPLVRLKSYHFRTELG